MSKPSPTHSCTEVTSDGSYRFHSHLQFQNMLRIERKRAERSKNAFLLMLLDLSPFMESRQNEEIADEIKLALVSCLRETDIMGWYEDQRTMGVIFTGILSADRHSLEEIIRKMHNRLSEKLKPEWIKKIGISFHVYPEAIAAAVSKGSFNISLYPDLTRQDFGKQLSLMVKRMIDVAGSFVALVVFSPILLASALAVKLSSQGPVFYRQQRMGLNGTAFTMLKFRTMYSNCDPGDHKSYIEKYIGNKNDAAFKPGIFKLRHDSRITGIGRFLRKTSIDELPQLINVLQGEMSLIGPRPPIPYEYDLYDTWHKRRLLMCKPGITGLWQVMGRSRTTFDEMVRLDLKYISEWSIWLDLKILFKTPKAVLSGNGAY